MTVRDLDNCDYCGAPIGFYGCPKHGVDCYIEDFGEGSRSELDARTGGLHPAETCGNDCAGCCEQGEVS